MHMNLSFLTKVIFLTLFFIGSDAYGQKTYRIEVSLDDEMIDVQEAVDSVSISTMITELQDQYTLDGYYDLMIDTSGRVIKVDLGEQYRFGKINIAEEDIPLIASAGMQAYRWDDKALTGKSAKVMPRKLIRYLENHGYPRAVVRLDDVELIDHQLYGNLKVDRGELVTYDSLRFIMPIAINKDFISDYLSLKKGDLFSLEKVLDIKKRLRNLPYLTLETDPQLKLYNNQAEISLLIKENASNRFDFMIGVLPNTTDGVQKFNIVGEFNAELYNRLGIGEYVHASVSRYSKENQEVNIKTRFPYIKSFPFGAQGAFRLYRKSNDFLEMKSSIGFNTEQIRNSYELNFLYNTSRLIEVDTSRLLLRGKLPNQLDLSYTGIEIGYQMNNLDYRFNPISGYMMNTSIAIGRKKIIRNRTIESLSNESVDFVAAYDSISLSTIQYDGKLDMSYYLPTKTFGAAMIHLDAGIILNEEGVYTNEFYRIGGNASIRGFDELSILTDRYVIATLGYKLVLDRNSYLTLPFIDMGWASVRGADGIRYWNRMISGGLAFNFATKVGMFNIAFAMGKSTDIPLDFNNTKIHFGYTGLF